MIQIGGVYTTFCQEEGMLLQKYRDRNGRCIAILFRKYPGSGVDVTLLSIGDTICHKNITRLSRNFSNLGLL